MQATVTTSKGTFQAVGDASVDNVGDEIAPHLVRMAETRAIVRALRWATNSASTAEEEIDADGSTAVFDRRFKGNGNGNGDKKITTRQMGMILGSCESRTNDRSNSAPRSKRTFRHISGRTQRRSSQRPHQGTDGGLISIRSRNHTASRGSLWGRFSFPRRLHLVQPHISYSQVSQYLRCGLAYRFKYVDHVSIRSSLHER